MDSVFHGPKLGGASEGRANFAARKILGGRAPAKSYDHRGLWGPHWAFCSKIKGKWPNFRAHAKGARGFLRSIYNHVKLGFRSRTNDSKAQKSFKLPITALKYANNRPASAEGTYVPSPGRFRSVRAAR